MFRNLNAHILVLVVIVTSVLDARALDDHLFNIRFLFRDAFRVHIDGIESMMSGSFSQNSNNPPENTSKKTALHRVYKKNQENWRLSCHELALLSYEDWYRERSSLRNGEDNEKNWSTLANQLNFERWNSPSYATAELNRSFLVFGKLSSARISIAVKKEEILLTDVIDLSKMAITEETIRLLSQLRGRNYKNIYESHISNKKIILESSIKCDDFDIYNLEIE